MNKRIKIWSECNKFHRNQEIHCWIKWKILTNSIWLLYALFVIVMIDTESYSAWYEFLGPMGSQNTKFQNSANLCLWVESKFSKRGSWKKLVVHYLKLTVTAIQRSLVISICDKSTFSDDILLVFCHMSWY